MNDPDTMHRRLQTVKWLARQFKGRSREELKAWLDRKLAGARDEAARDYFTWQAREAWQILSGVRTEPQPPVTDENRRIACP